MTKTYELINFATSNTVASFDSWEEARDAFDDLAAAAVVADRDRRDTGERLTLDELLDHFGVVAFDDEGLVDDEDV